MFSNLSANSMFFATVTPSFVIFGGPYDWSMTTFRPLGPRVTLTAEASCSTPLSMRARASVAYLMSLPEAKERRWTEFVASGRLEATCREATFCTVAPDDAMIRRYMERGAP